MTHTPASTWPDMIVTQESDLTGGLIHFVPDEVIVNHQPDGVWIGWPGKEVHRYDHGLVIRASEAIKMCHANLSDEDKIRILTERQTISKVFSSLRLKHIRPKLKHVWSQEEVQYEWDRWTDEQQGAYERYRDACFGMMGIDSNGNVSIQDRTVAASYAASKVENLEIPKRFRSKRRWTRDETQIAWKRWSEAQKLRYTRYRSLALQSRNCKPSELTDSVRQSIAGWAAEKVENTQ